MRKDFSSFRVLTFDCYGTLIDWESGIWSAFQPVLSGSGRTDLTRSMVLRQFATLESSQQNTTPGMLYSDILRTVHTRFSLDNQLMTNEEMDQQFSDSLQDWPAFPDSAEALTLLQSRFQLVILSNVDRAGFAASNRKLGVKFDAIYTAEDIGTYKPDSANFKYLLQCLKEDFGLRRSDVLHVAQSLRHDHVPARQVGLANVWIDRQNLSRGGTDWKGSDGGATAPVDEIPETDFIFYSMREFAESVTG